MLKNPCASTVAKIIARTIALVTIQLKVKALFLAYLSARAKQNAITNDD